MRTRACGQERADKSVRSGHASPARGGTPTLLACGSRSLAARNRTRLAIARDTQSHAAPACKHSRSRAGCGRTRPRKPENVMVPGDRGRGRDVQEHKRTCSASRSAVHRRAPHATCVDGVRTQESDTEAKHAVRALGIQRWQSQTGQARQGSSRRPAKTQTPVRSGAGLLTHAASSCRKRGSRLVLAWAPSQRVSACAVYDNKKGLSEACARGRGTQEAKREKARQASGLSCAPARLRLRACGAPVVSAMCSTTG